MARRVGRFFDPRRLLVVFLLVTGAPSAVPVTAQTPEPLDLLIPASLGVWLEPATLAWSDSTGVPVRVTVDATSRLVSQVERGAPIDLLFTADRRWMDQAVASGVVVEPRQVATNSLVLVAAVGTQLRGAELPELLSAHRVGVASEEVPAGRYAREAFAALGVEPEHVTGGSVRSALEWVARGEVDLAVVYASDARGDARVEVLHTLDPGLHSPIEYWGAMARGVGSDGRALLGHIEEVLGAGELSSPEARPQPSPAGPSLQSAFGISIVVALFAVLLGTLPAIGVGRLLATRRIPGRSLITGLLLAPLVIPPVVTGFLLLSLFGAGGPLGGLIGTSFAFTPFAAVVAATAVGIPLYAVVARRAFESVDRRYEELSWTLGVPPRSTFRRVALPLAVPGILAGAVLAFARALGEFGATIVVAGNIEGETRTIALAVYTLLEQPGASRQIWAFVGASVGLSLLALVLYERLLDRQRAVMEGGRIG